MYRIFSLWINMPTGLSLIETEIDSDDPNQKKKGGSAGWLGTDQQRGRHWIWNMGRTNGNSGPVDRGKQVLTPIDPGILHVTFWGCGKYATEWACVACTRAALWQAGKRPVEPLQLKGLESEGECAAHQDDTQTRKVSSYSLEGSWDVVRREWKISNQKAKTNKPKTSLYYYE